MVAAPHRPITTADKLVTVLWRDLLSATSYRLGFTFQFVGPLLMIVSFFFLSRLLEDTTVEELVPYGGEYFPFALVGLVFASYSGVFLRTVVSGVRQGQMTGTFEVVLTMRTSLATYLVGSSLYALLRSTVIVVVFLLLGIVVFGVDLGNANLGAGLLVLALIMLTMLGLGIISGSFILVYKRGDPVGLLITSGAYVLSGVVYPVAVLPGWLQTASLALPHTYALEALRLTLLRGASLGEIASDVAVLTIFATVTLPVGLALFKLAVRRAKVEGSFSQY